MTHIYIKISCMLEQVGMCMNGDFIVNDVQLILVWSQLVTCSTYLKNLFISTSFYSTLYVYIYFLWQLIKFRFFISSLMKELIILYYYCFVGISFCCSSSHSSFFFLFPTLLFFFVTYCRFSTSALFFTTHLMVTFVFSS